MNTSNSQEYYNEFFETFFEKGWFLSIQKIYDLRNEHIFGGELLLRVGLKGSHLDNSRFFPEVCDDERYIEVSLRILDLIKESIQSKQFAFPERTFINATPAEINNLQIFTSINELGTLFKENQKTLVVELSESFKKSDYLEYSKEIVELTKSGIELAIDDYGKGDLDYEIYKELDLTFVKIDKSLSVGNLHRKMVKSLLEFCASEGIICIAEGIETADVVNELKLNGINYGQGFYLDKPKSILFPQD